MHADRTNRVALVLLGLLLVAAGSAVVLLGAGVFGQGIATGPVLSDQVRQFVGANATWFWPAAAVLGLVVLVLALRWLVAIAFSGDRVGDYRLPGDRDFGDTILAAGALPAAVATEIGTYGGVHAAHARLVGAAAAPTLVIEATVAENGDLAAVRQRIEAEAVEHARSALDRPELPVTVDLAVTTRAVDRVR